MKNFFMMSLVTLLGMTMMSCTSININNNVDHTPTQVTELNKVTAMQPFDEVDITDAFKVIYEQGDAHSVRVEASEQAFNEMTIYVKDGELRIRKSVNKPTVSFKQVKVYVTSPDIKSIDLAGSGVFAASQRINASGDLSVDIAGSGNVMLVDVTCKNADFEIAGSGNIEVGQLAANEVKAEIAGSGDVNLEVMTCTRFDIEIAGSGNVTCNNITADDVHTGIAGSGDVNLKGNVMRSTKDVAGSGKVNITTLSDSINQ